MEDRLQIKLLGEFRMVFQDQIVTDVNTPRLQSLLAYLLLHRQAPQSRQRLSFLFWPDSSESQARTNLRNLLYLLRESLPQAERFLSIDNQSLLWKTESPFKLDAAEFEASLERAESAEERGDLAACIQALQAAIELYSGDLLPSCYDDWILPEREQLSTEFVQACKRLIELQEGQREYGQAIEEARRLLRRDPLDEWVYRKLMRLQAQQGELPQALQTYHQCEETLEQELGVEPSAATRELYEQLLAVGAQPLRIPHGEALGWPLVGREEAWRRLRAAWKIAAESRPHLAILSGEAGVGKTRLGEELLHWAAGQGILVGHTRSYPGEGSLAYTPILNLLRAQPFKQQTISLEEVWLREAARLLPEILTERPDLAPPAPLTEAWQRQRLFEACARAILAGKKPVLILVDDLQWCDRETLEWLHYLLRFEPPPQLLVVGAVRPEEVAPESHLASLCTDLHRSGQLTQIELDRLSPQQTLDLTKAVIGKAPSRELAGMIYQESEGNPLFVVEMTQAHMGSGPHSQGSVDFMNMGVPLQTGTPSSLPPKIQSVIATRLAQLSPRARQLASAAAVIGREFSFDSLDLVLPGDEEALAQDLDELWLLRIIRERGPTHYDFGHDKFREVIYEGMSPPRRAYLHRKVAQALEEQHRSHLEGAAARLAHHYSAGGEQESALKYLVMAGGQAIRLYAHDEAIDYYHKALDILGEKPATHRLPLLGEALQGLGKALLRQARYAEAEEVFSRLTAEGQKSGQTEAQAQGWLGLSVVHDRIGSHLAARLAAEKAEEAARIAGAEQEMATALLLKGWASCRLGDQKEALLQGEKALQLNRALGNRREMGRCLNLLGQANDALGNYDQARQYKEKALELFRELGDTRWVGSMLNNLANTANLRGQYEEAVPLYEEALDIVEQVSDRDWERVFLVNLGAARVGMRDYRAAAKDLQRVVKLCEGTDWMGLSLTHYWLAEALIGTGEVEKAGEQARQALSRARGSGRKEDLGVAWRALGKYAARSSRPVLIDGKSETPTQCFHKSLETLELVEAQDEVAWTLRDWGEFEMRYGDSDHGEQMWQKARDIFTQLDMHEVVEKIDQARNEGGW